jgi:hypothetical protein
MNVIRETVRVVIEELEKNRLLDKCPPHVRKDQPIGREAISDYLGGPWKEMYQIRLIGEALAQLRDMEEGIINQEHLEKIPSFKKSHAIRKAVRGN